MVNIFVYEFVDEISYYFSMELSARDINPDDLPDEFYVCSLEDENLSDMFDFGIGVTEEESKQDFIEKNKNLLDSLKRLLKEIKC